MRDYYGVFYCGGGSIVPPVLISKHWTLNGAIKAFRRRNRHMYDHNWAEKHGLLYAGTFDKILKVSDGIFDARTNYAWEEFDGAGRGS